MDVLAGTADGLHRVSPAGVVRLAGGVFAALAVDGEAVWAVVDDVALHRGGLGRDLAAVATSDRPLRCLLATGAAVLAGTAGAGLVRLEGGRLVAVDGFSSVPGRSDWYTPWGGPPDTRSLAWGDGTLYANVHVGGIPRSRDGGATWEPTIDVDADVHQVIVAGDVVLAAAAHGLAVSSDEGAAWRWRSQGLHASYARAVTVAQETALVSVSDGPGGSHSALYRGALRGRDPLERCRGGLPEWFSGNVDTGCLVAAGSSVALADGGTVYRSPDAGGSWELLAADLPPVRCLAPVTVRREPVGRQVSRRRR